MEPIVVTDRETGSTARIAAHLGFNCYSFQAHVQDRVVDVLDASADFIDGQQRASHHGIPLLFPYPNRIREGKYTWDGVEYKLPSDVVAYDPTGNAIHGFCLDRPWRVVDKGVNFVVGQFQLSVDAPDRLPYWPGDLILEVRYELRSTTLRSEICVRNPSAHAVPWGFGTHPYFRLPLAAESRAGQCLIEAPAAEELELVGCLPTGKRSPIQPEKDLREGAYFDVLKLDDVMSGLAGAGDWITCQIMDEPSGLQVTQRFTRDFRELVVYTPPNRDAICLEPYTCMTDAINLEQQGIDAGLRVLEPGGEYHGVIEISAGLVIA